MERKRAFRSGVVLLELMAAILIFALAGAVCVQVLVKADSLATEARDLSDGINHASSAAEILRSAENHADALEMIQQAWPQARLGDEIIIPFENGELAIAGEADDGLWIYRIDWQVSGREIYELTLLRSDREVAS